MSSSQLLLTLVNNVLDLQKIEAGKMESRDVQFGLPSCILRAVTATQPVASMRSISLLVILNEKMIIFKPQSSDMCGNFGGRTFQLLRGSERDLSHQVLQISEQNCERADVLSGTFPQTAYGDPEKLSQRK